MRRHETTKGIAGEPGKSVSHEKVARAYVDASVQGV